MLRISAVLGGHLVNCEEEKASEELRSTEKKMSNNNVARGSEHPRRDEQDLDSRYGEIGISAVAAALQFKNEAKNPAYAPVVPRPDDRLADMAA